MDVWFYRADSAEAAEEAYRWLKNNRFIRDTKRKREEKMDEKSRQLAPKPKKAVGTTNCA